MFGFLMSAPSQSRGAPVPDSRQLLEYLAPGRQPRAQRRIGTDREKFVFRRRDLSRPPYGGADGIRALLERLQRFGWKPVMDGDNLIGLSEGQGAISLEPGGQFELSGAPLTTLHETCGELHRHLRQ